MISYIAKWNGSPPDDRVKSIMELGQMTAAIFTPHVNTGFRVRIDPNHIVEMTLTSVSEGGSSPQVENFTLHFLAPPNAPARQGSYAMVHDALGEFELFVVPVGRDARGVEYEAVFNRLRDSRWE